MLPTCERLDTDDPPRRHLDDRLVGDREVAPVDRLLEVGAQLDLRQPLARHRGVVDLPHPLAPALGRVHRRVRLAKHGSGLRPGVPERQSDAGTRGDAVARDLEWRQERRDDAVRHARRFLLGRLLQQDRELVAAQPGRRVTGPDELAQTTRDLDEEAVARRVAQPVVDELEVVDVEEDDADGCLVTPQERVVEAIGEQRAIGEPRE